MTSIASKCSPIDTSKWKIYDPILYFGIWKSRPITTVRLYIPLYKKWLQLSPLFHVAPHYKDWKTKRKHTSKGWLYWDMIKGSTRKAPPLPSDQDSNTGSPIMRTKLNIYDGGYPVYALWFSCSQKTFKLFGFTIFWLLEYVMNVVIETHRVHRIIYLRFYY